MGAAAAAMVAAADRRVDALVLDSCYMSIESVAYDVAKKYVNRCRTPASALNPWSLYTLDP